MPSNEYAIECTNLSKVFGTFTAVNGLNLSIKKGELFGFLGPNGAGKTTTIKMLTTLLKPTQGVAKVGSFDLENEAAAIRARIGIVPQTFALFEELTPIENLWYIGELFGMKKDQIDKRTKELLKIVNLQDKGHIQCEGFSGGMKQRLSVAASLLHTPDILFMDEPTTGLDPQSRIALRDLTKRLNETGMTIVYTTHDMDEADKLCERIAIMDKGKVIAEGTPQQLKRMHGGGNEIELELESYPQGIVDELEKLTKAKSTKRVGGKLIIRTGTQEKGILHTISHFLQKKSIGVNEMVATEPSLEDVFINLTAKDLRD